MSAVLEEAEGILKALEVSMHKGGSAENFHRMRRFVDYLRNRTMFHPAVAVSLGLALPAAGFAIGKYEQRLKDERETGQHLGR